MTINIATIITCYNRKAKTKQCLTQLYSACAKYNENHDENNNIRLTVYVTDDGCTDGTSSTIKEVCGNKELHIIQGDGKCYWAGGMRLAWTEALREKERWDFYLLLNDDTFIYDTCLCSLLNTHKHCIKTYGRPGIYSGITCAAEDKNTITYGGYVWTNYFLGRDRILTPTGQPQLCDKANSNIMLVDATIVKKIGIFHSGYIHGSADYDYSMQAIKKGTPVLVTSNICGVCDYDHNSEEQIKEKILSMNLQQRKEYFYNPLHSNHDMLLHLRRNLPQRYFLGYVGRILNMYTPKFYYFLSDIRNK